MTLDYSAEDDRPPARGWSTEVGVSPIAKTVWIATTIVIALGILDFFWRQSPTLRPYRDIFPRIDLNSELTLPAWYSSLLMAGSALAALIVAAAIRPEDRRLGRRWFALGIVFFYLSLDETIVIHERFTMPIRNSIDLPGFLAFAWVIVAVPFLLLGAWYFWPLVWRLAEPVRTRIIASGAIFVGGAVGMEMIAGEIATTNVVGTPYAIASIIEESLELVGLTLFLTTLVTLLVSKATVVRFEKTKRD